MSDYEKSVQFKSIRSPDLPFMKRKSSIHSNLRPYLEKRNCQKGQYTDRLFQPTRTSPAGNQTVKNKGFMWILDRRRKVHPAVLGGGPGVRRVEPVPLSKNCLEGRR